MPYQQFLWKVEAQSSESDRLATLKGWLAEETMDRQKQVFF